jgi:hypothetical protein
MWLVPLILRYEKKTVTYKWLGGCNYRIVSKGLNQVIKSKLDTMAKVV